MLRLNLSSRVAVALLGVLGAACSSGGPSTGVEGGHCYPNETCNVGLTCLSNLCVVVDAGGTAGVAGSTGIAGTSGANAGASGDAGAAGVSGTGEAGTTGTAGIVGGGAGTSVPPVDGGADASDASMDAITSPDVTLVRPPPCPAGPFEKPMAGTPQVVCNAGDSLSSLRYDSTTGAVWVPTESAFYFSTYPSNALSSSRYPAYGTAQGDIVKYTPGGGCEVVFPDVGTLGLAIAPDGRLIGASYKTSSISEFNLATGQPTVLASTATGVPMEVPVDMLLTPDGGMFFTTLVGAQGDGLYRIPPSSRTAMYLFSPQSFGPGMGTLTLSSDGRRLLAFGIGQVNLSATGQVLSGGVDSITQGQNGAVAYDCANNILVTNATAASKIVSFNGTMLGTFPAGRNLAFGGADGMTVLLLDQKNISVIRMNVPGVR
jgi:hypothetical protein